MEYIAIIGFVGWLFALLSMAPSAPPSVNRKAVVLDMSFADEAEDVLELQKAA